MATLGPYLRGFSVLDFEWILDSNRLRDSRFFELYFGFESPVSKEKNFPGFRISQANISLIPEFEFPYTLGEVSYQSGAEKVKE